MGEEPVFSSIRVLEAWDETERFRALRVDLFVAFELSRTAPARKALCEGLQTLAKGLGCSTVLYTLDSRGLPKDTQNKVDSWLKLGSTIEGVQLSQAAPMPAAC